MAKSKRQRSQDGGDIDMTPMIDVVFQLIIFFIVTITMAEVKDESIYLEMGEHGEEIETNDEESGASALVIDVNKLGRVSISNVEMTMAQLHKIVQGRMSRMGNTFQIWIRGDAETQHNDIRRVMDICTALGVGRVHFVAIKKSVTEGQEAFFATGARKNKPVPRKRR